MPVGEALLCYYIWPGCYKAKGRAVLAPGLDSKSCHNEIIRVSCYMYITSLEIMEYIAISDKGERTVCQLVISSNSIDHCASPSHHRSIIVEKPFASSQTCIYTKTGKWQRLGMIGVPKEHNLSLQQLFTTNRSECEVKVIISPFVTISHSNDHFPMKCRFALWGKGVYN